MERLLDMIPSWAMGIAVLTISIGITIILFNRRLKIKGKMFSINTNAINSEGLALAFEKVLDTQFDILKIEFKSRLREQMAYTEDKLKEIKEQTLKVHKQLLLTNGIPPDEIHTHPQIKTFEKIIFKLLTFMKDETRERFGEILELFSKEENINDDYNFIKANFEEYAHNIINIMIQDARNFISDDWVDNKIVTRKDSWESMNPIIKNIGGIIFQVLINGVKIQLKYSQLIKKLKSNQSEYIKNITSCK